MDELLTNLVKSRKDVMDMVSTVLVKRTGDIDQFYSGGHGGRGLSIILHYCKPYNDQPDQQNSWDRSYWYKLFRHGVPYKVQLEFLEAIEAHYQARNKGAQRRVHGSFADKEYRGPLGDSHDTEAFVRWANWLHADLSSSSRQSVALMIGIRKFRSSSALQIIPKDVVILIAKTAWLLRPKAKKSFLMEPPSRIWLD